MSKKNKIRRPKARLPKGMKDGEASEIRAMNAMLEKIRTVYELYGFEPLETPAFEYSDALGKFLPDQDRPNVGVFSFEDEDKQWLSLRYDMTAPLARYVALNYDRLPKPYRRYAAGSVWRNEKPGPGRFRQFTQFDADTVGTPVGASDAEMCMLMADVMEAVGIKRGDYVIRVNNRKILDGVMEANGLADDENAAKRLTVLRAIDKFDRLGLDGVVELLGQGRRDESGDITPGANLTDRQINSIVNFTGWGEAHSSSQSNFGYDEVTFANFEESVGTTEIGLEGIADLKTIASLCRSANYGEDRIQIDPSVVRGLEYYTGPVFEAEVTFDVKNDKGQVVQFGSVGGGGRYDGLVARFKGIEIPATGFSIGVSRLYTALQALDQLDDQTRGPVLVLVMDKERTADMQAMTFELRNAGIRTEMYVGGSGMRAQMKYADKRAAPCVIIQGSDEFAAGEVTIKDLVKGSEMSKEITDNKEWREGRPAQFAVKRDELIEAVLSVLKRHEA
ncbi:MAG: histidine--tRNA ligase [bacterium]|nr:histidine--tRNA ligase [bacterium]